MTEINDNILKTVKKVHFVGIGGSGMCPLAEILHSKGYTLTGSDVNETDTTARVRALGIPVYMGHAPENIGDAQLVVYTAAVNLQNPELVEAAARGIPLLERSKLLGMITRKYPMTVCISGTHGKTTTTSMLSQVLLSSGLDPTVVIGGKLPLIDSNGHAGSSEIMVCEACEYVDTFLQLSPDVSIILNVDADHLDYFGTLENVIKSFRKFAAATSKTLIVNGDDANSMKAISGIHKKVITFGLSAQSDYYATHLTLFDGAYYEYDLMGKDGLIAHIRLGTPGRHNVYNSLGAIAAALYLDVPPADIEKHITAFKGAGRRFEIYGTFNGITVADDYAHHPNEIIATLDAAKKLPYQRVLAIFQPFTFSRTIRWLQEFADALKAADMIIISPIMGSRESNSYHISSQDMANLIPGSVCLDTYEQIADYAIANVQKGDFVITMGGGDIYKAARIIKDRLING